MRLQIRQKRPFDHDEPLALARGDAVYLWKTAGDRSLTMACPVCGEEVALLDHSIEWHDDTAITVTPSIRHDSTEYGKPCGAHFMISKNEITFLADSNLPKGGQFDHLSLHK